MSISVNRDERVYKLVWLSARYDAVYPLAAVVGEHLWKITKGWKGLWLILGDSKYPDGKNHMIIKFFKDEEYEDTELAAKCYAQKLQDGMDELR